MPVYPTDMSRFRANKVLNDGTAIGVDAQGKVVWIDDPSRMLYLPAEVVTVTVSPNIYNQMREKVNKGF